MPLKSAPPEVQAYFEALSPEHREQLGALRSHIRHLWPEAEEDFSFRLPTYRVGGKPAFALAGQKTGLVLHVIAYDLLEPFKHDMMRMDCGRSCFRFRQLTPDLHELFDRVIKYVGSQIHLSRRSARPTTHRKALPPR
jgi:uncharacterized protein YdhG (YjbR/CyaY superfamily)